VWVVHRLAVAPWPRVAAGGCRRAFKGINPIASNWPVWTGAGRMYFVKAIRVIAWIVISVSLIIAFYCGYAFTFWAWVTATPLRSEHLAEAQHVGNIRFGFTCLAVLVAVVSLITALLIPYHSKPETSP